MEYTAPGEGIKDMNPISVRFGGEKVEMANQIPADQYHFYQDLVAHMGTLTEKYPSLRLLEIIAIMARATGYCIAMSEPEVQEMMRKMAVENIDRVIKEQMAAKLPLAGP